MVATNGHAHPSGSLRRVEINVDCGESFGMWEGGPDQALMPMIDAANIACGGHAGDPVIMRRTVALAKEFGVKVGARKSACNFKTDPKTPGSQTRSALGDGYWR